MLLQEDLYIVNKAQEYTGNRGHEINVEKTEYLLYYRNCIRYHVPIKEMWKC